LAKNQIICFLEKMSNSFLIEKHLINKKLQLPPQMKFFKFFSNFFYLSNRGSPNEWGPFSGNPVRFGEIGEL